MLGPIEVGIVILVVVMIVMIAIVGGFLQSRRERLLTHAERMKALEMGLPLPEDPSVKKMKARQDHQRALPGVNDPPLPEASRFAKSCFSIAFWVGFWGFLFAAQSTQGAGGNAVPIAIASTVGAVCVTSVICGTILAARASTHAPELTFKPQGDPDAYDVAGRRG